MTYIGGEVIISPLGRTTEENWTAICNGQSGISFIRDAGFDRKGLYLSKFGDCKNAYTFTNLIIQALETVSGKIDKAILKSDRTIVLISSTKGELAASLPDPFGGAMAALTSRFKLVHSPVVVSNACISGVLAINAASMFISAGLYEHVIVIGCDVISDFIVFGFQSLFAISDQPCAPFDVDRKGITMGEGCCAVVLSASQSVFSACPLQLLSGTSANDANHISGPSRTGEGLFRSVKKTMEANSIVPSDIDFISAHGTATVYNDDMESIAFDRLSLANVPLNSMKGYFGHTLGAAGVIETAVSMQMLRAGTLLKSPGYNAAGTARSLNVLSENRRFNIKTILKTASGFGGGNASLIIRSL